MKKTLQLLKVEMQSSSGLTPQFQTFYNTFKKEFTALLKKENCTKIEFSKGHFDVSGFFTTPSNQIYYFSLSDVRGMHLGYQINLMYRTAEHYKDWTSGSNQWVTLNDDVVQNMRLK